MWAALQERPQTQQRHRPVKNLGLLLGWLGLAMCTGIRPLLAIPQIADHTQMRKQPNVLEHVADPPAFGPHAQAAAGILQTDAIELDAGFLGCEEAGDDVD